MAALSCFYEIESATLRSLQDLCGDRHVSIIQGQLVVLFESDADREEFEARPRRCRIRFIEELRRQPSEPSPEPSEG